MSRKASAQLEDLYGNVFVVESRPEVKDEIRTAWDAKRRDDLEFAYNVNNSVHFGDISGSQFAQFREKYGQLYNNPILQQYMNNIGQRLVPRDSLNVYSRELAPPAWS